MCLFPSYPLASWELELLGHCLTLCLLPPLPFHGSQALHWLPSLVTLLSSQLPKAHRVETSPQASLLLSLYLVPVTVLWSGSDCFLAASWPFMGAITLLSSRLWSPKSHTCSLGPVGPLTLAELLSVKELPPSPGFLGISPHL